MYIARVLYPVKNLGPHDRLGIWVSGCQRRCNGCANPELRERAEEHRISLDAFMKLVKMLPKMPQAVTITGGEPFDQAGELVPLCEWLVSEVSDDILIYTGYTLEQLRAREDADTDHLLELIAALVDGEYKEELNLGNGIKGSENQRLYVLREKYEREYRSLDVVTGGERAVQPFIRHNGSVITTGFERPGFIADFSRNLQDSVNNGGKHE